MSVSTSYTYNGTRSLNTLSVPSLTMSRIAVYKPPRSSPLAGPAISVNIDDDHDGDDDTATESRRNERSHTSATAHSRLSSPYPTPPRTPSPSSDDSTAEAQGAKTTTPEIRAGSSEPSSKTWSKFPAKQPRPSAPTGNIDASSRLLGKNHQDESSTRRSSRTYVRTPFSAPPTMPDFHPSYDTNAISVRAVQRPRTVPVSSSSSTIPPRPSSSSLASYASPAERGTFSAPGIIRSTTAQGRHEVPNTRSKSDCDCKASVSSSSNHHSLNTSSNPKLNWITVSNNSPPPFSRTLLTQSVVMPVKATEAEVVKRSPRRPKTTPNLKTSSISALSGFRMQEVVNMSQPVPIIKSSKEEIRERSYQPGPFSSPSHDGSACDMQMSKEVGNEDEGPRNGEVLSNLCDNEDEKAGPEGLAIEDRRTGVGGGKWKLKLLLKVLGKAGL